MKIKKNSEKNKALIRKDIALELFSLRNIIEKESQLAIEVLIEKGLTLKDVNASNDARNNYLPYMYHHTTNDEHGRLVNITDIYFLNDLQITDMYKSETYLDDHGAINSKLLGYSQKGPYLTSLGVFVLSVTHNVKQDNDAHLPNNVAYIVKNKIADITDVEVDVKKMNQINHIDDLAIIRNMHETVFITRTLGEENTLPIPDFGKENSEYSLIIEREKYL